MSLQDLVDLTAIKSPLVSGGNPTAEDLARFLWILSTDFQPGEQGFHSFIARLDLGNAVQTLRDSYEYIDFCFLDRPGAGRIEGNPCVSFAASLVDFFQSEYEWKRDETLSTPLPQLFQLQRAAMIRRGAKVSVFNRTESRAMLAYVAARNAVPEEYRERWHQDQWKEMNRG